LWDDQGELSKGKVLQSSRDQCILNIDFSPELGMQAETQKNNAKNKNKRTILTKFIKHYASKTLQLSDFEP
jgi:hypothetical protein